MSYIDVKNKKGTSGRTPPAGYSTWLDFWEKEKGMKATKCEVLACGGRADLGGHVIKLGEGGREYILPMCYTCNNKTEGEAFKAWEGDLIPVL